MADILTEKEREILNYYNLKNYSNDRRRFKKMLKRGLDPNSIDGETGNPILFRWAQREEDEILAVEILLDYGADINMKNNLGQNVLTGINNTETLKFLVEKGINMNDQDMHGKTALMHFVKGYAKEEMIFRQLLELGADPNLKDLFGRDALNYVIKSENNTDKLKLLISNNADLNSADEEGITGLMHAASDQYKYNQLELLLNSGADPNLQDIYGNTALYYSVFMANPKSTELLLNNGADPNIQNKFGETVMVLITIKEKNNHIEELKLILDHGGDHKIKDHKGMNAYDYATREDSSRLLKYAELIRQYGAKSSPFWIGRRMRYQCPECAQEVPLNSPSKKLKCHFCQSIFDVSEDLFKAIDSPFKKSDPACAYCEKKLDIDQIKTDTEETHNCPDCGKAYYSFTAPEWIKSASVEELHPSFIINSVGKTNSLKADDEKMQTVAVRCISCSAAMSVNPDTPRNVTCEHCGTVQYLPDQLWLSLHPSPKMLRWYIKYE